MEELMECVCDLCCFSHSELSEEEFESQCSDCPVVAKIRALGLFPDSEV